MRRRALPLLLAFVPGCLGDGDVPFPDEEDGPRSAVIGLGIDAPLLGRVERLAVSVATAGGESLVDESLVPDDAHLEVAVPSVEPGTRLLVEVAAFGEGDEPLLHRTAQTDTVAERVLLLPLRLNDECLEVPGERDTSCPGATCSAGVCISPYVEPFKLPDYRDDWDRPPAGACGEVDVGEPRVTILHPDGAPMKAGDLVTPQQGLQGASHFFLDVLASGIDDASAVTHHFGIVIDSGRETSVVSIEAPLIVDGDGCHRDELPLVLPPEDLAGRMFRVGVTVGDATGNAGHEHVDVLLDEALPP
ncbi:MAG: hypothetical protein R3B72_13080 [Polyangiaceae bacterium]